MNLASLTTWTADDRDLWQIQIQSSFMFGTIESCQRFNNNLASLEYRQLSQKFNLTLTCFGEPETQEEFEARLPILQLIEKTGREHEVDSGKLTLAKRFYPTACMTLKDYISRFKQDTVFYLIASAVFREDEMIVA